MVFGFLPYSIRNTGFPAFLEPRQVGFGVDHIVARLGPIALEIEVFPADGVDQGKIARRARQGLGVLRDDQEARPLAPGVIGDRADPVDHPAPGVGLAVFLPELEAIDDVEVDTIVALGHDPVEGCLRGTENEALPERVPVTDLVVARPVGVLRAEPGRRVGLPGTLPVGSIVFGLADREISQDDPWLAGRLAAEPGERIGLEPGPSASGSITSRSASERLAAATSSFCN